MAELTVNMILLVLAVPARLRVLFSSHVPAAITSWRVLLLLVSPVEIRKANIALVFVGFTFRIQTFSVLETV